ncbi:hypothetical protein L6164_021577 [Bauhinia variegata]|uniref:Uncharacterized protein n=1 Tax=Bauhinia variegata TaxID=167791 RepID=A0ACB9MYX5_BAUVA|nr:hypothetical protein L6164_021577 [Bauhinia variegata]
MTEDYEFTQEEMVVDENLGYPKAYAKLSRDRCFSPFSHGPPFTFMPYALQKDEAARARDLDKMFPINDPKAKPTTNPKIFLSLLWKQLSHLGNAGFDPEVIRVDAYGNVLYYHADSASPLAWNIDHWFPCSRGGLTVSSNLRIMQWQACKRKKNKLEFLIPWWDLQMGISVNQFLSLFASSNSDFRHRAFPFLFSEGENEELNASQIVDSHSFPQHFIGLKEQVGLAPAAVVESRREPCDTGSALRQLDYNRKPWPMSPAIVAERKSKGSLLKENEDPDFVKNPYQAIVVARDSLERREEAKRMQAEMQKLDDEVNEIKLKNEEEKLIIQDLELTLIKRRRKAEKCRRLAEAQSSYKTALEKMIRDSMRQTVIYKEEVRLNQAATNALMARLEAQRAICDSAEKELHKKQIRPEWEHGRKRSRIDYSIFEKNHGKPLLYLPGIRPKTPLHRELRVFLEEEQRASEAGLSANEEQKQELKEEELQIQADKITREKLKEHNRSIVALKDENSIEHKVQKLEISEGKKKCGISFPVHQEPETEEDEEIKKQRGKGNLDKWLQMLLENSQGDLEQPKETIETVTSETEEIIKQLNQTFPQKELNTSQNPDSEGVEKRLQYFEDKHCRKEKQDNIENKTTSNSFMQTGNKSFTEETSTSLEGMERREQHKRERKLVRSESAKALRRIPSSPSLLLRKGADYVRKKALSKW